jgi:hypothetical protein
MPFRKRLYLKFLLPLILLFRGPQIQKQPESKGPEKWSDEWWHEALNETPPPNAD